MKKKMNVWFLLLAVGSVDDYLQASTIKNPKNYEQQLKYDLKIMEENLEDGDRSLNLDPNEQKYIDTKNAIPYPSSSSFDDIRASLTRFDASENNIQSVIQGYAAAFDTDIDLDARNSCLDRLGFFINFGFYKELFTSLKLMIKASAIQFMIDQNFDQRLQSVYIPKFTSDNDYQVEYNFYNTIGKFPRKEIREVCLLLQQICVMQGDFFKQLDGISQENVSNQKYNSFKGTVRNSLMRLTRMRNSLQSFLA
jgi:hypothetical protein